MAILNNNPLIGSGGNQGYNINNSLRLRSSASASLSRTPASTSNQKTWTWSGWVKRGTLGSTQTIFMAGPSDYSTLYFTSGDALAFDQNTSGATSARITTSAVYRDPSAWYHIILAYDSTQATSSNRIKLYVNGSQVTAFSSSTYPNLNDNAQYNLNTIHYFSRNSQSAIQYVDGYLAEVNFIDGSQKAASDFGETDTTTGVWKPKAYSGTYGTNGFYLKFSDIATTSGSNAGLGKDFSGNSNYWTTNNISVTSGSTYDAMKDVPTLTSAIVANYCVLNPLNIGSGSSLTSANLNFTTSSSIGNIQQAQVFGSLGVSSGKWYWEILYSSANTAMVGVCNASQTPALNQYVNNYIRCYRVNGNKESGTASTAYGATWTSGDVIGIALDIDSGTITFYKNNVSQGTAFSDLAGNTWFPYATENSSGVSSSGNINFGQRPFTYTPPTGYLALNTYNLPTPTILQGNKYMDATLWTGNGTSQTITNAGLFRPDFVWVKQRNSTAWHSLVDAVRGVTKYLYSNTTDAEGTQTTLLTSFNSNGFSLSSDSNVNGSGSTYVGWQWQAGQGSTSSNTDGDVTSTVSVNTTAGFSIAKFTTQASGTGTVGHGLGIAPSMMILKPNTTANTWIVWHSAFPASQYLRLQATNAVATGTTYFNSTAPTSSVITLGTAYAGSTPVVAYVFAEIAGFSKFGSYTGNGSTDGPFVATNFAPKFVMIKRTDSTGSWFMVDTSRNTYNLTDLSLYANLADAEGASTSHCIDILSNGFKCKGVGTNINASGGTYIYMAFASNPFKNSLAR